jgi:hypothetical protein
MLFGSSKPTKQIFGSLRLASRAAARTARSFGACTSIDVIEAEALRSACSNVLELRAREFGFSKMILSTAEVQKAAIAFYAKSGFQLVRTEVAATMSTKTVGGGLTRFHFEKLL